MAKQQYLQIHPKALIIMFFGALASVWLAARHGSFLEGLGFLIFAIILSAGANYLQRKR